MVGRSSCVFFVVVVLCACGRLHYERSEPPPAAADADPVDADAGRAYAIGSGVSSRSTSGPCPVGYIPVLPAPRVGTHRGFCVARYEMQDVGGVATSAPGNRPWARADQIESRTRCEVLGPGFALISNAEWMTIARDIESVPDNWEGGVIGTRLNRGHTDGSPRDSIAPGSDDEPCIGTQDGCSPTSWHAQRRTHTLSNGEILWDFSGNLREYVDSNVVVGKPSPVEGWRELNTAVPTGAMPATAFKSADESLRQDNGIGGYYPGPDGSGGAVSRGGYYGDGHRAGVFTLFTPNRPTASGTGTGFRCTFHPGDS